MSDFKQAISQDSYIQKDRLKEARNVEFLADCKYFKKGDKSVMHFTVAEKLLENYPKSVKVSNLDQEAEIEKAKKVASVKD